MTETSAQLIPRAKLTARWNCRLPEWDGISWEVGEFWRLRKGVHDRAHCTLWTHPAGAELRITVNGDLHWCEASPDGIELAQFIQ
jgi:hypothetical protein